MALKAQVTQLAEVFWSMGISTPVDYVQQISLLLAYRQMDQLPAELQWKTVTGMANEAALDRLHREVWPRVLSDLDGSLFTDAALLVQDAACLGTLMHKVDALPWEDHGDLIGDIFEILLEHMQEKGLNGQFRTPYTIVEFIVQAVDPQPQEVVWDPAAGTGSFLLAAHRHCQEAHVTGSEIDRQMARLAALNAYTHRLPVDTVAREDTLAWALDPLVMFGDHPQSFDVIVANPPFGGRVPAREVPLLGKRTSKSEVQFLGAIAQRLAPNGRAGIVLPSGILFSRHAEALRRHLLDSCRVRVVQLPDGAFQPYTDVSTAVMFLEKRGRSDSVGFFGAMLDGTPSDQDMRRYLSDALVWLANGAHGNEHTCTIDVASVMGNGCNLEPDSYRQVTPQQADLPEPKQLLQDMLGLDGAYLGHLTKLAALMDVSQPKQGCGQAVERLLLGLDSQSGREMAEVEDGLVAWLKTYMPRRLLRRALN